MTDDPDANRLPDSKSPSRPGGEARERQLSVQRLQWPEFTSRTRRAPEQKCCPDDALLDAAGDFAHQTHAMRRPWQVHALNPFTHAYFCLHTRRLCNVSLSHFHGQTPNFLLTHVILVGVTCGSSMSPCVKVGMWLLHTVPHPVYATDVKLTRLPAITSLCSSKSWPPS